MAQQLSILLQKQHAIMLYHACTLQLATAHCFAHGKEPDGASKQASMSARALTVLCSKQRKAASCTWLKGLH